MLDYHPGPALAEYRAQKPTAPLITASDGTVREVF